MIVVGFPGRDDPPCVGKVVEQVLIQAFVAQPSVEALDEAVLHWFSGCDVMPFDAALISPFEDGVGG